MGLGIDKSQIWASSDRQVPSLGLVIRLEARRLSRAQHRGLPTAIAIDPCSGLVPIPQPLGIRAPALGTIPSRFLGSAHGIAGVVAATGAAFVLLATARA